MRMVFGLVLLLGVALAGAAAYLARDYINVYQSELAQARDAQSRAVPLAEVYVTTRQIRYGEWLTPEDVRAVSWPRTALPEGAFHTAETLFPDGNAKPRSVLRTMEKDEPLLAVKLTDPGEDAGVSSRLAQGMRAFAIRVDVTSGVSGFLRPGDRVDVYWTGTVAKNGPGANEVTKLIDSGVRLVGIDQSADEDRNSPAVARTVTVQATPRQVAALAQAQATGRLSLALVGARDDETAEAVEIDQNELLGIEEQRVVEVKKTPTCSVRTRRANEVVEIAIPCRD